MCEDLTPKQQAYVDSVTDCENATKYRSISPGLCGSCPECQSQFGMKLEQDDFQYFEWEERGLAHIELRNEKTDYTLIEFWDDDVGQFLEDYRGRNQSIADCLWEYVDDCSILDNVPDDVFKEIMNDKISREIYLDEGSFSWSSCACCGSRLGGDRYCAHGFDDDGEIIHFDICTNCLYFLANGDVPPDEYLDNGVFETSNDE